MPWMYLSDSGNSAIFREIILTVKGLPDELNKFCKDILLECEQFCSYERLSSFCRGHSTLYFLNFELKSASNQDELFELNLPIFLENNHKEYGWSFSNLLKALIKNCHEGDEGKKEKLQKILAEIVKLNNQPQGDPRGNAIESKTIIEYRQILFKSIIEQIDFIEQENAVIEALKRNSTGAFLVHGYDERYGQKIFITRLFRKFPQFKNYMKITISLAGMSKVKELWNQTSSYFYDSDQTSEISPEQIRYKIFECLETQNIIFIFSEADRAYKSFIPKVINEFWKPIVEVKNQKKCCLTMILIDSRRTVCVKAKDYLAWNHLEHQYPKFPLHLDSNSNFSEQLLDQWLNNAIKQKIVPKDVLPGALMKESEGGVPELVYRKICSYCDVPWEEFEQCLIQ
ncbi:hypothetical protein JYQ62_09420 [Nostoc sp. UHCC 0702]|nr:hypothetical protein JYQ62_09420 [Nostoc sp. UHCC 0702]